MTLSVTHQKVSGIAPIAAPTPIVTPTDWNATHTITAAGLSVLGVASNSPGAVTDIVGSASQVLQVDATGTTLAFSAISVSSGPITGVLPVSHGGTGGSTPSGTLLDNITGFSVTGFLERTGAGTYAFIADPLPVSHGGTGGSAASGTLLDNITGFAGTGFVERTGAGAYTFIADPLPVSHGGTGATTPAGAQANLGLPLVLTANTTLFVRSTAATISFTNASANITWTSHGLSVNDAVVISILPQANNGITITNANPGVVTWTAHGFSAGQPIVFDTTGYLPAGVTPGTTYFVIATGLAANTFQFSTTVGGAGVNTTKITFVASNSGGNLLFTTTGAVAHNLVVGQEVAFADGGGGLPAGITASTTYYVSTTGFTTSAVEVSTTNGGTPVPAGALGGANNTFEQVGGTSSVNYGAAATHRGSKAGAMPTFSVAGLLVAGTVYFVGTVVDANTITLSTTINNANPLGTATLATGSPVYSASTGNDANNGSAATRSGAFLTLQGAATYAINTFNFDGRIVTIQAADSTYTANISVTVPPPGSGTLQFIGNTAKPTNCVSSGGFSGTTYAVFSVQGFKLTNIGTSFSAATYCTINFSNVEFGPASSGQQIFVASNATIIAGAYAVSTGTSNQHVITTFGGTYSGANSTVLLYGVPAFSQWILEALTGAGQLINNTYIGGATGGRYSVTSLSLLQVNGAGATLPGNVLGSSDASSVVS